MALRVLLDIDHVLADWSRSFVKVLVARTGREPSIAVGPEDQWPPTWSWFQLDYSAAEVRAAMGATNSDPSFWINMVPCSRVAKALAKLATLEAQSHVELYFATARPGCAKRATERWLSTYVPHPTVCTAISDKGRFAAALGTDLFVDDDPRNVLAVLAADPLRRTTSFIVDRPYNRVEHPAIIAAGGRVAADIREVVEWIEQRAAADVGSGREQAIT